MIKLEPGELEYMTEMRMLTTDEAGRTVLVGLTEEESDFYIAYSRAAVTEEPRRHNPAERDRYLELHGRHERARFQVLGAEHELRVNRPVVN